MCYARKTKAYAHILRYSCVEHREYYIGGHANIKVVWLTFSAAKYTVKMITKFNKLYTNLKIGTYWIISCRLFSCYRLHCILTLIVLVATIDVLGHFETG